MKNAGKKATKSRFQIELSFEVDQQHRLEN